MSWPSYLELHASGELAGRARRAELLLGRPCRVCPRGCRVDRLSGERAPCGVGRRAIVASAFPHLGEEDCLRGRRGSGTIFFAGCNLRCVFCQNHWISWGRTGTEVDPTSLASSMLELQLAGCHNVNLVTPEHVVPQILGALPLAVEGGLRLPLVYNTSAYDGPESLAFLDGIVDIYMPDMKLWTPEAARRYLRRADYPSVARRAIREMHRQVGVLVTDERGIARRGVLLRHLVMPGLTEETARILEWVASELGPGTYVNLMAQFRPDHLVAPARYGEIDRRVTRSEYLGALQLARGLGLRVDARGALEGSLLRA